MGKTFQALERHKKESGNSNHQDRGETPGRDHDHGVLPDRHPTESKAEGRVETPDETPSFRIPNRKKPSWESGDINKNLVAFTAPRSFEAEQFKLLKAQILYEPEGSFPSPIAITSALPGEGKSFVSANLALSIAQQPDLHVLLIDCDLRKPQVHALFGCRARPGLSEYLTNGVELADILVKTPETRLTLIPAGAPPENPSELLSSKRMSNLLREVSSRYEDRVIILDTPPVAMTAEGNTLAKIVEAVLLVVRHNYSPKEQLKELVKRMGSEKIMGTVLNHMDKYAQNYSRYRKYPYKF